MFQGHLLPGPEYLRLSRLLVKHAGRRIRHAWLAMSGAMANENALKAILQKHAPADRIVVFGRAFHGRTLAMAEMTDKPAFRDGLPLRGNVLQIPFYDPNDPDSTDKSVAALEAHLKRYPGRIAAMCFELVQEKGGFHTAPREFFVALMECCKRAKLAVWVDEVQTFARTGELFAYRWLELDKYVDIVTVGKVLQGSATLMTPKYNPRPGLVSGTYAGATVGMAVGARIIERLESEGYLGPEGRIAVLARRIDARFESLRKRMPRAIGERSGVGAMQAFVAFDGSAEVARKVFEHCFEEGLILLTAGVDPTKLRMLPPREHDRRRARRGFRSAREGARAHRRRARRTGVTRCWFCAPSKSATSTTCWRSLGSSIRSTCPASATSSPAASRARSGRSPGRSRKARRASTRSSWRTATRGAASVRA